MKVASPLDIDLFTWSEDFMDQVVSFAYFADALFYRCGPASVDKQAWLSDLIGCINNDRPFDSLSILRLVHQCVVYLLSEDEDKVAYTDLFIEDYKEVLSQIIDLVWLKNRDYGSSAFSYPIFVPWIKPSVAILVRMSDKVARIRNLLGNQSLSVPSEAIEDTVRDLVGYLCLLWCVVRTEQLEDSKK